MKKRFFTVAVVIGIIMMASFASAGLLDRFKIGKNTPKEIEVKAVTEDLTARDLIPKEPRLPTKDDAGFYAYGETGAGLWGDSESYTGVLGTSKDETGVVATTGTGFWAVWAYNKKAETTGWLGAFRTGVLGLVKNKDFFAGEFLGGKGVYSENGYATRYMGNEARLVPGQYTFETTDGKLVTVTNGIITAIKSKV